MIEIGKKIYRSRRNFGGRAYTLKNNCAWSQATVGYKTVRKPDSNRGKLEFSKLVFVILLDNLVSRLVFKNLEAEVFRCGLMTLDSSQKRSLTRTINIFFEIMGHSKNLIDLYIYAV